ncbi:hypothetical protein BGW38_010933, partial [Lunasporangiospora selenospora]
MGLRKLQYYFYAFTTLYIATGVGAVILGNMWLQQSEDGATREAVISRGIIQ